MQAAPKGTLRPEPCGPGTDSLQREGSFASTAPERNEVPLSQRILGMGVSEKIKLALTGDKEARCLLARDPNKLILSYLLQNPRIMEVEILAMAHGRNIPEEILLSITRKKEWMKRYPVRLAVVQNPKAPLPVALKLLATVRDPDLRKIARSRDVSGHLSAGARRILMRRGLL